MAAGDTRTEHFLDVLAHGSRADIPQENCCNTKTQNYILGAINRIIDVEEEVEWLENNPDVADIVATYAALQAYDTSSLTDKDIIRVLSDETHEGQSTYYRYDKSDDSWDFIGTIGDYYTKTQLDTILEGKQDVLTAGENITIAEESGALVISATGGGASYTAGDGIDITNDVISATNTGKAKVLTTADYNWNDITSTTENPNSLALWLLPPGVYQTSGMRVQMTKSEGLGTGSSNLWVVAKADNTAVSFRIPIADPRYNQPILYICNATTGQKGGGSNTGIMRTSDIVDGLTSTAADKVLSAKQGKALKDLIDALVIPTKTSDIVNDGSDGTSTYVEADELPAVLTNAQYNALWSQPNQLNLILENIVSGGGV